MLKKIEENIRWQEFLRDKEESSNSLNKKNVVSYYDGYIDGLKEIADEIKKKEKTEEERYRIF